MEDVLRGSDNTNSMFLDRFSKDFPTEFLRGKTGTETERNNGQSILPQSSMLSVKCKTPTRQRERPGPRGVFPGTGRKKYGEGAFANGVD